MIGANAHEEATSATLEIHFNERGHTKELLGLAKGKEKHDKWGAIAARDWRRDKERLMRDKGWGEQYFAAMDQNAGPGWASPRLN